MRRWLRARIAWAHPEWWALALSVVAWLAIAVSAVGAARSGAHAHDVQRVTSFVTDVQQWILMVLAMMVPLSVGSIQATAERSLWRRRHRAIAWWLVGYLAPWTAFGSFLSLLASSLDAGGQAAPGALVAFVFAAAAIWQATLLRARAVSGCHQTQPLAPTGWRANYDCVRYGWATGANCVAACGVLMTASYLLGHGIGGLLAMVTVTFVGLSERYAVRPNRGLLASAVGVHAIVVAAFLPS